MIDYRTILAQIWLGNITMWNDTAIQELNPHLSLPHHNITLAFDLGDIFGITSVLTGALSLFYPPFADVYNASFTPYGLIEDTSVYRTHMAIGFDAPGERLIYLSVSKLSPVLRA